MRDDPHVVALVTRASGEIKTEEILVAERTAALRVAFAQRGRCLE